MNSKVAISTLMSKKTDQILFSRFCFPDFDCPIDGTCLGQGTCDDTTGTCVCNEGYEGVICEGNYRGSPHFVISQFVIPAIS